MSNGTVFSDCYDRIVGRSEKGCRSATPPGNLDVASFGGLGTIYGVMVRNPHSTRGSPVTTGHKRIDPWEANYLLALRSKSNP